MKHLHISPEMRRGIVVGLPPSQYGIKTPTDKWSEVAELHDEAVAQTSLFEEHAHHRELANQDEAAGTPCSAWWITVPTGLAVAIASLGAMWYFR